MAKEHVRGFTMPELLITVAIVAVLASIAAPAMSGLMKRSRMTAMHNEFLSSLFLLRSEAAKRNRVMKMCRSTGAAACATSAGGWHQGWTIWADDDGNNQVDAGETVVQTHNGFPGDTRMTGNASVVNRIAFQPTGTLWGVTNGTFTICAPGIAFKQQIIVSKPGRPRVAKEPSDGTC